MKKRNQLKYFCRILIMGFVLISKPFVSHSQQLKVDSTLTNLDFADIFESLGISFNKVVLPETFKGAFLNFSIREYTNGEVSYQIDSIPNSKVIETQYRNEFRKYIISFVTSKEASGNECELLTINLACDDNLRISSLSGYKFCYKLNPWYYRWTSLIDSSRVLIPNTEIALLAFTPFPYIDTKPGIPAFCQLPFYADKTDKWHEIFKLEHYYIVSFKILKH